MKKKDLNDSNTNRFINEVHNKNHSSKPNMIDITNKNNKQTKSENKNFSSDLVVDIESSASDGHVSATDERPKEKLILKNPKYKHNRIERSSSKTKVVDYDKLEILRSRSGRRINSLNLGTDDSANSIRTSKDIKSEKNLRPQHCHSNLNLQNIVRFVMNNKKGILNSDDFVLKSRKSLSEAAINVIGAISTRKPLPTALQYSHNNIVADVKKNSNEKRESFGDFANKNKFTHFNFVGNSVSLSDNAKNIGIFEEEAFFSCDENGNERSSAKQSLSLENDRGKSLKIKNTSPSLTSRVAAKINETTANYKNRKAAKKTDKKTTNDINNRGEYYKQLSVERLNSISIVRHPSDRRPDTNNSSNRVNGNLSIVLNASDLQNSLNNTATFPDSSNFITGSSIDGGIQQLNATSSNATTPQQTATAANSNVPIGAFSNTVGSNALDAATESSKDILRERFNHQQNKSSVVSVNRSESYKERLSNKRNRHTRRKTSDPSLTSRQNDEQTELGLSNSNYIASSNSSFSSGSRSESPSTSMEQVGAAATTTINQHQHVPQSHHHSHQDSFHGSIGSAGSSNTSFWGTANTSTGQVLRPLNYESEEDDDANETDWSSLVAAETLATLTDAEKKRQEIINEIYQTERSHVRTLKLLDRLFFCPLQENNVLSQDHLMLLFPPALISLRELHSAFEQKIKLRRQEHNHVVNHIGDLLASMFDGPAGNELREHAAQFCARQQIALEALKEKRRKDEQLQKLLTKAEAHKACRRLQLKDLLPAVLQRLTKYPLLFENLYKVTIRVVPENTNEAEAIQRALESSKKILVDVNQAVKTAEDAHKLQNIQRKLDKSTFDKDEFKNLDLTHYRLIHDGSLTMKKNPGFQLHGLLFETMIVLLTKQDDKYSLKYLHAARNTEVNNKPVSPIMSIDSDTLVRQEAADKNSFFLIKTKTSQMLELRAPSSSECKTWFKHISDAAEQYKPRSKNANLEPLDDPAIATIPHSNTKESFELTPERIAPQSATATVTTTPLAPLMPVSMSNLTFNNVENPQNTDEKVQLRTDKNNTRSNPDDNDYYNLTNMPLSQNDLQAATASNINRTLSTRSCGESNSYSTDGHDTNATTNGTPLRHTQSARHANETGSAEDTKRESASIVYSTNSNDTRTLLMQSPLVQPTAIQISVSPAHTAEPVLTPAERLRRLDTSISKGLLEKQKIICEMFRVPIEHFDEIVDIAALPEAPKDSADIALAAYDQIQKLTNIINDYMNVTPEQVISAVSTAVCDSCNKKETNVEKMKNSLSSSKIQVSSNVVDTQICKDNLPPPLPPPNRTVSNAQPQTPLPSMSKTQIQSINFPEVHEDDDGYCEIDELRLPGFPNQKTFESYDLAPTQLTTESNLLGATTETTDTSTTLPPGLQEIGANEILKHESSLSAESIPEEKSSPEICKDILEVVDHEVDPTEFTGTNIEEFNNTSQNEEKCDIDEENENHITKIDVFLNAKNTSTKCVIPMCTMADTSSQTDNISLHEDNTKSVQCGTNRLQHVRSLEPSVPCHALNSIVSALNEQISLLLPKLNERDMERERLRKENQHLRELLNAMHGRQRVPATPGPQETVESQGAEEISGGDETNSANDKNHSILQVDDEKNIPN